MPSDNASLSGLAKDDNSAKQAITGETVDAGTNPAATLGSGMPGTLFTGADPSPTLVPLAQRADAPSSDNPLTDLGTKVADMEKRLAKAEGEVAELQDAATKEGAAQLAPEDRAALDMVRGFMGPV